MKSEADELVAELVVEPEPVKLSRSERRSLGAQERIRYVEDELLARSQSIIEDVLDFAEIDPADDGKNELLKQRWAREMGSVEAAERRFRIALAAWASNSAVPAGIKIAHEMYLGITKARSKELTIKIGVLNAVVQMPMCSTADKLLGGSDDKD